MSYYFSGVLASLCFPTFPRFCGTVFLRSQDKGLAGRCISAWNDFSIDEWCAAAPDRLIPLILLPLWDVAASVEEMFERFDPCQPGVRVSAAYSAPTELVAEAVGEGVKKVKPGDRVYTAKTLTGAYAEYCLVMENQVHLLPTNVSFSQGAGVFVRLRSVVSTARKQGCNILRALTENPANLLAAIAA